MIALEPQSQRFHDLVNTVHLNKFENVTPLRLGAGSTPGEAPLYTDVVSPSFHETEHTSRFETVQIRTLDEILDAQNVDRVAMIKIDVEGFELEVLRGAAHILGDDAAPVLCIEVGILGVGHREVADVLAGYNDYRLYRLSRTKSCYSRLVPISRCDEFSHHDNIICIPSNRIEEFPRALFTRSS